MNPISTLIEKITAENIWDEPRTLMRNEFLIEPGMVHTNSYFVVSGSMRVFVVDEGEEQTIRFGYQGSIIAALDSVFGGKPTEFYIQALKKTTVQCVRKSDLKKLVESSIENSKLWVSLLESFALQQMERERDILTTSPIERYLRVLKRSPQLFQEIPHKYIASYLRMTPETLSRIQKS